MGRARLLTATLIIGLGATLSLTGCTGASNGTSTSSSPSSAASQTATSSATPRTVPSATPSVQPTQSTAAARAQIDSTYSAVFDGLYHMSKATAKKITSLNSDFAGGNAGSYNRQVRTLIPGLKHVNQKGVSAQALATFYYSLTSVTLPVIAADTTGIFKDLHFSVKESSINLLNDHAAKVPSGAIQGTYKGETHPSSSSATLYAVRVDGVWYVDPTRANQ